jgi:hypothetical protein
MKFLFCSLAAVILGIAAPKNASAGNPYDSLASLHNECVEYLLEFQARLQHPVPLSELSKTLNDFAASKGYEKIGSFDLAPYSKYLKVSNDELVRKLEADGKISAELASYIRNIEAGFNAFSESITLEEVLAYVREKEESLHMSAEDSDKALKFLAILKKSTALWMNPNAQNRCGIGCWICTAIADAAGILIFAGTGDIIDIIFQVLGGASVSAIARCCICGKCGDDPCWVTITVQN